MDLRRQGTDDRDDHREDDDAEDEAAPGELVFGDHVGRAAGSDDRGEGSSAGDEQTHAHHLEDGVVMRFGALERDGLGEIAPVPGHRPTHEIHGELEFALEGIHEDPKEGENEGDREDDEDNPHDDEENFLASFALIKDVVLSLVGSLARLLAPSAEFLFKPSGWTHKSKPHVLEAAVEPVACRDDDRSGHQRAEEAQGGRRLQGRSLARLVYLQADRHGRVAAARKEERLEGGAEDGHH
ncbi:MAG: hypothetical protein WCR98_06820, partial [Saccharofermentanales bacterium]